MNCTISLKDGRVFVETKSGPVRHKKEITPRRLAQLFLDSLADSVSRSRAYDYETPVLPRNTVAFKASEDMTRFAAALFVEASVRKTVFYSDTYEIPHPDYLFLFKVAKGRVADTWVFAVRTSLIEPDTQLYRFPFGNVYPEGRVCWGQNALPEIKEPLRLEMLPFLFLDSPYNGDMYDGENPFRVYLEELSKMPVFPAKTLKPYMRFGEAFEQI